jgi:hypothetical protein
MSGEIRGESRKSKERLFILSVHSRGLDWDIALDADSMATNRGRDNWVIETLKIAGIFHNIRDWKNSSIDSCEAGAQSKEREHGDSYNKNKRMT